MILLAIGDFADDNGVAYPSVNTIASKTKLSERGVQYLLARLQASGELSIERNAGPKGCNLFRVQSVQGCNPDAKGVQTEVKRGARAIAPESSRTIKEPSVRKKPEASADVRLQPFKDFIFRTYREMLGELITDASDWKALTELLRRAKNLSLEQLQDSWLLFLSSKDPFIRKQGHPLRYFSTNINPFLKIPKAIEKRYHFDNKTFLVSKHTCTRCEKPHEWECDDFHCDFGVERPCRESFKKRGPPRGG